MPDERRKLLDLEVRDDRNSHSITVELEKGSRVALTLDHNPWTTATVSLSPADAARIADALSEAVRMTGVSVRG